MTEKKLKVLFDFQRFQGSQALERLIQETDTRWNAILSEDDLEQVSAAGESIPEASQEAPNDKL